MLTLSRGFELLGDYVLFLVLWGAVGIIGLIAGVVVVVNAARQMERAAAQSSRAAKPEDVLAA